MEKHIKVTIISSNFHLIHPQTYYITKSGVIQSLRKPQDGTVRIGRESLRDPNFVYNDIMLYSSNPMISRSHCFINYQEFFRDPIPLGVLSFLMGNHFRLGQKSILLNLPQTLFKYILDFLLEPRLPIIISPSSVTYMRLDCKKPQKLASEMSIIVGSDYYLTVVLANEFYCCMKSDRSSKSLSLSYEEGKEYLIGKEDLDEFEFERISKIQMRVLCHKKDWYILDGSKDKPSAYGTWFRLGNGPEYLKNKTEIKIGEFILKIDF